MADIIDSLKRLERIGSENSKTTQKLIDAARELSSVIAQQFVPGEDEEIIVVRHFGQIDKSDVFGYPTYTVARGKPKQGEAFRGSLYRSGEFVGKNREEALGFSNDLAKGLLECIVEALEKRHAENQTAIGNLQAAVKRLADEPER
jgi:hypothetical protein